MEDETVPGALQRRVDALAAILTTIESVAEGEPVPTPLADFEFGVLHRELAAMIVGAAWNLAGTWEGRFSAVIMAASRVTEIEDQRAQIDHASLREAKAALAHEVRECAHVSEDCVRSIEWAIRQLVEMETADLPEDSAAKAALIGAIHVGAAYAVPGPADEIGHPNLRTAFQRIGRLGAEVRHTKTRALKAWALAQAATMKGADKAVARDLAKVVPAEFAQISDDPERLIYDALRARKSTDGR